MAEQLPGGEPFKTHFETFAKEEGTVELLKSHYLGIADAAHLSLRAFNNRSIFKERTGNSRPLSLEVAVFVVEEADLFLHVRYLTERTNGWFPGLTTEEAFDLRSALHTIRACDPLTDDEFRWICDIYPTRCLTDAGAMEEELRNRGNLESVTERYAAWMVAPGIEHPFAPYDRYGGQAELSAVAHAQVHSTIYDALERLFPNESPLDS